MYTSCFAKHAWHPDAVNIAARPPASFEGKSYPPLYPDEWTIWSYKRYLQGKQGISWDEYTKRYNAKLSRLDPKQVYDDLGNDAILLCWEQSGNCHRRLVAVWLEKKLGVKVKEI